MVIRTGVEPVTHRLKVVASTAGNPKNKTPLTIPLVPEVVEILSRLKEGATSERVFPAPKSATGHLVEPRKAWERILARAGIVDARIHDLRRTLGSWMAIGGASLPVIGKGLGHKSQATTAIYARLSLDPVREAMQRATGAMRGQEVGER
ncbi:MAG: site-specific integrase [Magnetococcales bacterium]|nr:site-specific integrase [Magnetococcales bacterium]